MPKYIEELVSKQVRMSELARERGTKEKNVSPGPVITISRTMGSGARIVAQKLASDLNWSFWAKELIEAIAQNASVSRKVVERFDEHTISEIELLARAALGDHEMGDFLYPRHLTRAILSIAKLGNAIILGRGASYILPNALSVRIDAPLELRIKNMMQFENLSREEAETKLKHSDRDREHFLVSTFGKDRVHAHHYELSLWMDKFSIDDAVDILKAAVDTRRVKVTG